MVTKEDHVLKYRLSPGFIEVLIEDEETVYIIINQNTEGDDYIYRFKNEMPEDQYLIAYDEVTKKEYATAALAITYEEVVSIFRPN